MPLSTKLDNRIMFKMQATEIDQINGFDACEHVFTIISWNKTNLHFCIKTFVHSVSSVPLIKHAFSPYGIYMN